MTMTDSPLPLQFTTQDVLLRRRTRVALLLLAALYPLFHAIDYVVVPDLVATTLVLRLAVAVLALGAVVGLRSIPDGRALALYSTVPILAAGLGMVLITALDAGFSSPFDAGVLMCLFGALFMPWNVRTAGLYVGVLVAAYTVVNAGVHGFTGDAVMPTSVLVGSAVVVLFAMDSRYEHRNRTAEAALQLESAYAAECRAREAEARLVERDTRLVAVGMQTSALAHDLRNQLQSAMIYADLAANAIDDPTTREDLSFMALALRRAVNDLAEVVEYAKGGEPARAAPTQLSILFRDTLGPLAAKARLHGVELTWPAVPKATVELNAGQVARAVENLVHNAIEAVENPGGRVEVRVDFADQLVIEVVDDGPGVPESQRAEIFEVFKSDRHGGTGLGLATVRNVARAHGGEVELVETEVGAAFRMTIPTLASE